MVGSGAPQHAWPNHCVNNTCMLAWGIGWDPMCSAALCFEACAHRPLQRADLRCDLKKVCFSPTTTCCAVLCCAVLCNCLRCRWKEGGNNHWCSAQEHDGAGNQQVPVEQQLRNGAQHATAGLSGVVRCHTVCWVAQQLLRCTSVWAGGH